MTPLETVGCIASISTQIMRLSAIPSILEIIRAKSELAYTPEPYIASMSSNMISITYAATISQPVVVVSGLINFTLNIPFFYVHYLYSKNPNETLVYLCQRLLFVIVMLSVLPITAAVLISGPQLDNVVLNWFGFCSFVGTCVFYSSQLTKIREIVATKNAASISPPLTAGVTFTCMTWSVFSFMSQDPVYILSSVIGLFFCSITIFVLLKYPRIHPSRESSNPNSRVELEVVGKMEA